MLGATLQRVLCRPHVSIDNIESIQSLTVEHGVATLGSLHSVMTAFCVVQQLPKNSSNWTAPWCAQNLIVLGETQCSSVRYPTVGHTFVCRSDLYTKFHTTNFLSRVVPPYKDSTLCFLVAVLPPVLPVTWSVFVHVLARPLNVIDQSTPLRANSTALPTYSPVRTP